MCRGRKGNVACRRGPGWSFGLLEGPGQVPLEIFRETSKKVFWSVLGEVGGKVKWEVEG